MADHSLRNCRILVVEDEYLIAEDLQTELGDFAAVVLGPVGTLDGALDLIRSDQQIDGAVLDVNLGGEPIFPAADLLLERGVPFVFTTGYDESAIPPRFQHIARCEKPVNITQVARAIGRAIHD